MIVSVIYIGLGLVVPWYKCGMVCSSGKLTVCDVSPMVYISGISIALVWFVVVGDLQYVIFICGLHVRVALGSILECIVQLWCLE